MCRNIKILFNFDPPVTPDEIQAASLQFVRKISGFNKPSKANEEAFLLAIDQVAEAATGLLHSLQTTAPARNREEEAAEARASGAARFGTGIPAVSTQHSVKTTRPRRCMSPTRRADPRRRNATTPEVETWPRTI